MISDIHASVHRQEQAIESLRGELAMILERLKEFAGDLLPTSQPQQPVAQVAPTGDTNWDQVIFGQEMAMDMSLSSDRRSMIDGLISEDPASMGLVGQLLVFRSATSERMPQLLKDVGEAYYRWRPETQHGNDPMRDALIIWLGRICDANSVANTIEIVTPGDRYDAARHHAKERGIEVDSVVGWVVLRDNGKVYTKASVSVK